MPYKHVRIAGTRRQVGQALGKLARPLMSAYLTRARPGKRCAHGAGILDALAAQAGAALPAVWEEFEGLAEGLDMPLADALLWNCRGDLLHKTTDGCTSAALKSADGTRWIGHNEDGDPYLYGCWWMWRWMTRPAISASTTPAPCPAIPSAPIAPDWSRPSTTCARANGTKACRACSWRARRWTVPRWTRPCSCCAPRPAPGLSSHAGLGAGRQAVQRRSAARRCLYTGNRRALRPRQPHDPRRHRRPASSRHRFVARAPAPIEGIVDSWSPATGGAELLAALHDTEGALPILRTDRHDPDGENTLATAVFEIGDGEVTLRVRPQAARGDRAGRDERSGKSAARGKPDASRAAPRGCRPAPTARRSRRLPAFPPRTHRPDAAGRCPADPAAAPCRRPARHSCGPCAPGWPPDRPNGACRRLFDRIAAVNVLQEAHAAHAAVAARIATAAPGAMTDLIRFQPHRETELQHFRIGQARVGRVCLHHRGAGETLVARTGRVDADRTGPGTPEMVS